MIQLSDIRFWIMDRTPADNPLSGDLEFTDEEIRLAMRAAGRAYNSIGPFSHFVDIDCLPDDTNIFFDATAEFLYRSRLQGLKRNSMDYSGGGVTVNEDSVKIKMMEGLLKDLAGWRETAAVIKNKIDNTGYYQEFGV